MKRILIGTLLLLTALTASAQKFQRRGVALGADRDTLLYIIASPFDNWYMTVGGGIQTFIGNEVESSARHNKLNFGGRVEVGKWIIPDLAVSLRFSAFNVDGQSRYGLQPFIDYTADEANDNGYYPYHAHAMSLLGLVTFDWTNFLKGYEAGKRSHLHVFSPVGLGMSMLYGAQRNPRASYEVGKFRRNFELAFTGGVGIEYEVSKELAVNLTGELFGSESTWDWSPYDNAHSIFDLIPMLNVGVKFNLLNNVTKYDPYKHTSSRQKVNHEFLAFGTRNTLTSLNGRIERLSTEVDSLQTLSDERSRTDSALLADKMRQLDSLRNAADRMRDSLEHSYRPANALEELIAMNEVLNLPATIVYFQLDKYEIDFNGRKRLQNFARELNNLDDTVEFYIIGGADSATGTVRHNQWLSEKRCQAAFDLLTRHYDVDASQLITVPLGGITEYEPQENNRMALIIMRSPVTEEIINRWLRKRQR